MSNKVVRLQEPSVNKDLLKMAKGIVAQIKSVEITGLFVIACGRGGELTTHRSLNESDKLRVLGYMEWSKWCLLESIGKTRLEPEEEEQ